MCVMSMVGDHYSDKWEPIKPLLPQHPYDGGPFDPRGIPGKQGQTFPIDWPSVFKEKVTREEFDALKRDVEECKKLLIKAKEYDENNGEPSCEMEAKVDLIKKIAVAVGVDLEDVFGKG